MIIHISDNRENRYPMMNLLFDGFGYRKNTFGNSLVSCSEKINGFGYMNGTSEIDLPRRHP